MRPARRPPATPVSTAVADLTRAATCVGRSPGLPGIGGGAARSAPGAVGRPSRRPGLSGGPGPGSQGKPALGHEEVVVPTSMSSVYQSREYWALSTEY